MGETIRMLFSVTSIMVTGNSIITRRTVATATNEYMLDGDIPHEDYLKLTTHNMLKLYAMAYAPGYITTVVPIQVYRGLEDAHK